MHAAVGIVIGLIVGGAIICAIELNMPAEYRLFRKRK